MRLYLIPIAILLLGVAAALPFRRDRQVSEEVAAIASGTPSTVAPLNEGSERPLNDAYVQKSLSAARERFANSLGNPSENPYEISVATIPSSYDEVAVPLMLDYEANNLLRGSSDVASATNHAPKVAVDRFGIPRPVTESPSYLASDHGNWSQLAGVGDYTDTLVAASELERRERSKQSAVSIEETTVDSLNERAETPDGSGTFRTASESRQRRNHEDEQAEAPEVSVDTTVGRFDSNSDETSDAGELPPPDKSPRKRFVIREPN